MTQDDSPSLWLVRHAQPLIAEGVCYGQLDIPADTELTAQAARALAPYVVHGAVMRYSPLLRCHQLAQNLQSLRPDLQRHPTPSPQLQEMNFGTWEGCAWSHIPRSEIDAWAADLATYAPGGGESLHHMLRRVQTAWMESWESDSEHGQRDVIWVTHAGVIRCVQWLLQSPSQPPTSADWRLPAPGFGSWLQLPWHLHSMPRLHVGVTAPTPQSNND